MLYRVHALELYYTAVKNMSVYLSPGYLFRQVSESGRVLNEPLSDSANYDRLNSYLVTLGIFYVEHRNAFGRMCNDIGIGKPHDTYRGHH